MKRFRMGQLYRYAKPASPGLPDIDGIPNFHYIVASDGSPTLQLERGINAPSRDHEDRSRDEARDR